MKTTIMKKTAMKKIKHQTHISKQAGIALPIALILLFVSTLIGITALRTSALSEKMTRNTIQRELAFNKAETALLEGEALVKDNATQIKNAIVGQILSNTCEASFNGAKGFCSPAGQPQSGATVSSTERWRINDLFTDQTEQRYIEADDGSRYIVEFLGHIWTTNNVSACATGSATVNKVWPYCEDDPLQFRITAFAEGDIPEETQVVLQTTYVAAPTP